MREIKFRGYAVEEMVGSQWLYGFGVSAIEYAEHFAKKIGREKDWYLYTDNGTIHVHEKSISQYTGLLDKNGKEIYFESDFVKLKVWFGYEPPSVCPVTHEIIDGREVEEVSYSGVVTRDKFGNPMIGDFYFTNLTFVDAYEFEVIHNIYENPELINS